MNLGKLTVREALPEDVERLGRLFDACAARHGKGTPQVYGHPEAGCYSQRSVRETIEDGNAAVLIAEDGDELTGTVQVRLKTPRGRGGWLAAVDCLVVEESQRRAGVGRKLMEAAHRWAAGRGATDVELSVWEFNREAIAFYTKLGYRTVRRQMWLPLGEGTAEGGRR